MLGFVADDGDRDENDEPVEPSGSAPEQEPTLVYLTSHGGPMLGAFGIEDALRRCLFCERREDAVAKLIAARGAYICDRCVRLAADAIDHPMTTDKLVRIRPPRVEPSNRVEAEEAIERAYETVLISGLSDPDRAAAIESGSNLLPTMREVQARAPMPSQLDMTIEYVRFIDEREAEVRFTLLLPGPRPVPGMQIPSKGYAVHQNGDWKMARATYAELIGRLGITVPPPE